MAASSSNMSNRRHLSFTQELHEADPNNAAYDINPPKYDPTGISPSDVSLDDDEEYDETEEEESERYSRQRGRSRSFNEHDNDAVVSIVTPVDPNTFTSAGSEPPPIKSSTDATAAAAVVAGTASGERSGPLQQREVLALKKGLEEATHTRNQDELIEEEEEKRAAESEKKKRQLSAHLAAAHPEIATPASEIQMRRVKILILGDSGVGKSSLIMRWTADTFRYACL